MTPKHCHFTDAPRQDGPFSLLSFPDQLLPDIVYEESTTGDRLTEAPSAVTRCHTLFEELRGRALTTDESTALIVKLLEASAREKGSR